MSVPTVLLEDGPGALRHIGAARRWGGPERWQVTATRTYSSYFSSDALCPGLSDATASCSVGSFARHSAALSGLPQAFPGYGIGRGRPVTRA